VAPLTAGFGPFTILATGPKHAASGTSRSPADGQKRFLDTDATRYKITRFVDKMLEITKINKRGLRGKMMEGDLADKPHIWVLPSAFLRGLLVCTILVFPTSLISDITPLPLQESYNNQISSLSTIQDSVQLTGLIQQHRQQALDLEMQKPGDTQPKPAEKSIAKPPQEASQGSGEKPSSRERLHIIIEEVATRYNVDPALIKAIIMAESGYNPRAVSKKGAIGLMQLMPSTAQELGVKELFDPEDNVEAGVRYFKRLLRRFGGDVRLALAAYNAGSTKVRRYRGVPPIGATRYYVKKVFHYYRLYKKESTARTDDA